MTSKMDNDWVKRELERRRAEEDERLVLAKGEARLRGKERFDLAAFEEIYDTTTDLGFEPPEEQRRRSYEVRYYLRYPDLTTMQELAEHLRNLDAYR